MNYTPIITLLNGVEVVSILHSIHEIGMIVHLTCDPLDSCSPENINLIRQKMDSTIKYLVDEEFIDDRKWSMKVGTIIHNPHEPPTQFGTTYP